MEDPTAWALAKAQDIVDCEGAALISCLHRLRIAEVEVENTLLAIAILEALLEAFALGRSTSEVEAEIAGRPCP